MALFREEWVPEELRYTPKPVPKNNETTSEYELHWEKSLCFPPANGIFRKQDII
jgi:hypothetical protein